MPCRVRKNTFESKKDKNKDLHMRLSKKFSFPLVNCFHKDENVLL